MGCVALCWEEVNAVWSAGSVMALVVDERKRDSGGDSTGWMELRVVGIVDPCFEPVVETSVPESVLASVRGASELGNLVVATSLMSERRGVEVDNPAAAFCDGRVLRLKYEPALAVDVSSVESLAPWVDGWAFGLKDVLGMAWPLSRRPLISIGALCWSRSPFAMLYRCLFCRGFILVLCMTCGGGRVSFDFSVSRSVTVAVSELSACRRPAETGSSGALGSGRGVLSTSAADGSGGRPVTSPGDAGPAVSSGAVGGRESDSVTNSRNHRTIHVMAAR